MTRSFLVRKWPTMYQLQWPFVAVRWGSLSIRRRKKITVQNQLDGGQTQQLITAINANMSSGQLQSLLPSNSPLSDQVSLAYSAKNGALPGNFKNVVVPNSPVSKDVRPSLNTTKTIQISTDPLKIFFDSLPLFTANNFSHDQGTIS